MDVLEQQSRVIGMLGHTADHIAYFNVARPDEPLLLCGDTLLSGGCGRLFEGTSEQILTSLNMLATLPAQMQVCPAHEYTLANLQFV